MYFILGLFVLISGIVMVASPQTVFEITERWKSYSASEPSHLYLNSTRFGGVLCILAGAIGIVVQFVG